MTSSRAPIRRVFFGGSFRPPHRAHHEILLALLKDSWADHVHLVPTGANPLKAPDAVSARLADPRVLRGTLEAWIAELPPELLPKLSLESFEIESTGPSYTVDGVARLRAAYPGDRFVMCGGGDLVPQLPRWREPERLLGLLEGLWIFPRVGHGDGLGSLPAAWRGLTSYRIMGGQLPPLSSSELRREGWGGATAADLAPGVEAFFRRERLFGG